jgi:UDP-N-acetylmuramate dehydrogenase
MSMIASLPAVRGTLVPNAPLAPFTWFRVGGPADLLFTPADEDDLAAFLDGLDPAIPVSVLGVGSNIIVRDGGIEGVVIRLVGGPFNRIETDPATACVTAGAGVPDAMVARAAAKAGIGGLEFLVGIPGSVGGALTMNAGCYGRETRDVLVQAWGVRRGEGLVCHPLAAMGFAYRHSAAPAGTVWTRAQFAGQPDEREAVQERMAQITARREASQPIRERTGGSTFKNPDPALSGGRSAWQCVDAAGLRGHRVGGAMVSEKHANFLINTGDATAADIETLGEEVRRLVHERLGVALEWEIRRVGRAGGGASPQPT